MASMLSLGLLFSLVVLSLSLGLLFLLVVLLLLFFGHNTDMAAAVFVFVFFDFFTFFALVLMESSLLVHTAIDLGCRE